MLFLWNNRWEAVQTTTNIHVEKGRPVILRFPKTLKIADLPIEKCPGLDDLLALQSNPRLKRSADTTLVSPVKKAACEDHQVSARNKPTDVELLNPHPSATQLSNPSTHCHPATESAVGPTSTQTDVEPARLGGPADSLQDATILGLPICVWVDGWKRIAQMKDDDNTSEKAAFPVVFGFPYVKPTVANYKKFWKSASDDLKDAFMALGDTKRASWRNFCRHLKAGTRPELPLPQTAGEFLFFWPTTSILTSDTCEDIGPPASTPMTSGKEQPMTTSDQQLSPIQEPASARVTSESESPLTDELQFEQSSSVHEETLTPASPNVQPAHQSRPSQELPLPSPLLNYSNIDVPPNVSTIKSEENWEDSTFNSFGQAENLCPYCDEELPTSPSDRLEAMKNSLELKTWPSPVSENPHHRAAASFQIFVSFCARHRFETTELPMAINAGWPLKPDFSTVFDRISKHYLFLAAIMESDEMVSMFFKSAKEYHRSRKGHRGMLHEVISSRFTEIGAG